MKSFIPVDLYLYAALTAFFEPCNSMKMKRKGAMRFSTRNGNPKVIKITVFTVLRLKCNFFIIGNRDMQIKSYWFLKIHLDFSYNNKQPIISYPIWIWEMSSFQRVILAIVKSAYCVVNVFFRGGKQFYNVFLFKLISFVYIYIYLSFLCVRVGTVVSHFNMVLNYGDLECLFWSTRSGSRLPLDGLLMWGFM